MVFKVNQDAAEEYEAVAAFIRTGVRFPERLCALYLSKFRTNSFGTQGYHAVFLQHEYGIFGGYRGELSTLLLRSLPPALPLILTLHTVETVPSPMVQHALFQFLSRSTGIVTLSPSGCRGVDGWGGAVGLPPLSGGGRCVAVPHGVPQLPLCEKGPLKSLLGFEASDFLILTGGLLSPPKGVEHVIRALLFILPHLPNALLIIAGEPHPSLGGAAYLSELQLLVSELKLEDSVQFHTRYFPQPELEQLYAAADVTVCAHIAREQTSSGTLLLAMAAGSVVVSTPFPQAAELLGGEGGGEKKGKFGILVPFRNASAIAEAVLGVARDGRRARAMRAAAQRLVGAERSWAAVGESYAALAFQGGDGVDRAAAAAEQSARFGDGEALTAGADAARGLVFSGKEYLEVGNREITLSSVRNVRWVDGVGPGWAPTDTYLSRYRDGGGLDGGGGLSGVDSLLMNGCFLSYVPGGGDGHKFFLRVLESADTEFSAISDDEGEGGGGGGGDGIAQSWSGALQDSGLGARVSRRMRLLPRGRQGFSLELAASLSGPGIDFSALTWLTIGFDQLSANPAVEWTDVGTEEGKGVRRTHPACSWAGDTLSRPSIRGFSFSGRKGGRDTSLSVSLLEGAEGGAEVHFTCNAEGRLQAVQFDIALREKSVQEGTLSVHARAEVVWK